LSNTGSTPKNLLAVIANKAQQSRSSARDKLRNLAFQEIKRFEIAAPASTMLGRA
jgi:hypothetical protein